MRGAALLLGAGLTLLGLGARAEAEPTEAERLYHEGQEAYDAQRYDAALALWQRSYALSKRPGLLFNIAQAYRLRGEAGDCARAVGSYKQFLRLDAGSARHAAAEGFIDELAECARASPAPEDGSTTPDPSEDGPSARTPAADPEAASQGRGGSARSRADTGSVRYSGSSGGTALRVIGGIVAGGGAVTALVGAYAGAQARELADELTRECMNGCQWDKIAARDAEGRSAEQRQWILYGVGAGGLVVGIALYYLGARAAAPAVAVTPGGGGGLVTWSGRW